MKGSGLGLGLLSAVFCLLWTTSTGLKALHFGSCVIATNLPEIQKGFSEIRDSVQAKDENIDIRILRRTESLQNTKPSARCCLLRHLLRLYLDRVFKNYQTSDHHTLRKISSLANSFLTIKKGLRLCHAHMTCHCGEEATEKYNQILSHFQELEPQAAVVKALGELDILLRWMEEIE
ncbi:interleukin-20 [Sciurus carolinensis]|uniref:interleukin-20 n=1 Tax=Sciurus carolinensis TaxID=30640 RepID=UPI001FB317BA|nr:interleukin-20 [Sciurus carolinensis]